MTSEIKAWVGLVVKPFELVKHSYVWLKTYKEQSTPAWSFFWISMRLLLSYLYLNFNLPRKTCSMLTFLILGGLSLGAYKNLCNIGNVHLYEVLNSRQRAKPKTIECIFFPLWVPAASKQRQLYDSTVAFCSKHYSGIYFFLVFCANSDIQLKKIPIAKKNNFCATATAQFSTLLRLLFVSFRVHPAQFNNLKTTISCWIANVPLGMMLLFMLLLLHSGNNRK